MPSKTLVINSALGALILALGAGTYLTATAAAPGAPVASRTVAVSRASISSMATASGSVSAATTVVNAQNCTGAVTSVAVSLGQHVSVGQKLAAIDPTNAQDALSTAEAQLESVRAQANQQQVSAQDQVSSAAQSVANAQQSAALDAAQAANAVAAAQKAIDADHASAGGPASAAAAQLSKDQQALTQAQNQQASAQLKDSQQVATAATALDNARNAAAVGAGTNVTSAQIAVNTAQKNLDSCTLTAPVAGSVTALNAVVGALTGSSSGSAGAAGASGTAASGTAASSGSSGSAGGLITISDTAHLQVVAGFSESDVSTMKVGQTAQFTFPALKQASGAAPVTGKVLSIAMTSTTSSGVVTYPVTVSVTNPPSSLRLGQSANLSITTATAQNALVVPTLAITTNGGRQTVNVAANGTVRTMPVTTGLAANGRTQVLTGVSEGDQIELPAVSGTLGTSPSTGRGGFGSGGAGFGGGSGSGGGR